MGAAHIMSVDLEEWFQVDSLKEAVPPAAWDTAESRLEEQTETVLTLFREFGVSATFFVVGWIAERFGELIRRIAAGGHEIASHGYAHRPVPDLGPDGFRRDLERSLTVLRDAAGTDILGYRAPCWSLTAECRWAFGVMRDAGLAYDSSIYPIRLKYGQPGWPRYGSIVDGGIREFPLSTYRIAGLNVPVAGGFFARAEPFWLLKRAVRSYEHAGEPFIAYFHPWEIDPAHPRVDVPFSGRIIHYYGLGGFKRKLALLCRTFKFVSFREYMREGARI